MRFENQTDKRPNENRQSSQSEKLQNKKSHLQEQ